MSLSYTCPYCQSKTEVSDQFSGQQGHCATCGKPIVIPDFDPTEQPTVLTSAGDSIGTRRKIGPRSRQIAVTLIFGTLVILLLTCVSLFVRFFMPGANSIQSAQQATACQTNLRQIHTALEAYRATNGTYPPAYSVDGNNRPMHSWRVLILPYLQLSPLEQMFVDQYDYTQSWDSSQNMRVSNRMPAVFQCPADTANVGSDTNYMAIAGPQSVFRAAKGVQMGQIIDDHSATLLIVETVGQMVPWTKPTDIAVATLAAGINSSSGQGISSSHPGGVHALMVDGTIRFLPQSTPASDIKGLSTIAGGEMVPLSE